MRHCPTVIAWLILAWAMRPPSVLAVKNLVVFGDSYSDAGNFHRWTNGPVWSENLAVAWNASLYSFAHTGSACDNALFPNASMDTPTPSIRDQVEHFYQLDMQLEPADTVFAIWVGVNDIQRSHQRKLGSSTPPTFENVSECIAQQIRNIRKVFGADRIMVFNVPPLQHMPFFAERDDKEKWEYAADQLNRLIQNEVIDQNKHHHALELDLIDVHSLLTDVMDDPSIFHFTNALDAYLDACRGACADNADDYVWWDRTHITGGLHRVIANSILLAGSYAKSTSLDVSADEAAALVDKPNSPFRSPIYTPSPPHTGLLDRIVQEITAQGPPTVYVAQEDLGDDFLGNQLLTGASFLLLLGIVVIVWSRQQRKRRSRGGQVGILGSLQR